MSFAHLDAALTEASIQCHASADRQAVIYYTTDRDIADRESGERYIVFRGDQPARHHLQDNWRACYSVSAEESQVITTVGELVKALEAFPKDAPVRICTVANDYDISRVVRHPGQSVTVESEESEDEMEYWRRAGLDQRGQP